MLPLRRAVAVALVCAAGTAAADELDDEAEAIRARVPVGTAFDKVPAAMKTLGFACAEAGWPYKDLYGRPRQLQHYVCVREEPFLLVCVRRTRATVLQETARVVNVIVNVGRFCLGL
jgi:hypothetical protein